MRTFDDYRKKWDDKIYSEEEMLILEQLAELMHQFISARIEKGWSQRELAERAGVKQSAIARFESLGVIPQVDTLLRIANALGLKVQIVNEQAAS